MGGGGTGLNYNLPNVGRNSDKLSSSLLLDNNDNINEVEMNVIVNDNTKLMQKNGSITCTFEPLVHY